jgi:ectoine hydroxylase
MIPLAKNTYANGALMVIPGSHKEYVSCPKPSRHSSPEENFADQKEGLPDRNAIEYFMNKSGGVVSVIECEPTDLVLFDCNLLHVSNPNVTPHQRTNLFFVYNNIDNALKQPYCEASQRPEWMGSRLTMKGIVK